MSEKMYPIPFDSLMNWVTSEYAQCGDVFGVHKHYHASGKSLPIFGERIETPFGPAAGPNSQLAQNIIAAYAAGARFFEVKTVQKMDGAELAACVPRPCILAADEGYNQEWSTELTVQQAQDEYIKAWCALKVISKVYGLVDPDGFVFNMSVGYDLDGIKGRKVNTYINNMMDAGKTAQFKECKKVLTELFPEEKDFIASISPNVSRSVTLSTLHGCPPQEIERIASYLLKEKHLHTFVKCNPTILGYKTARSILDSMGYDYIVFDEHHFNEDLQWEDAVPMFERLQKLADKQDLEFGLKLSNTFPVDTTRGELPNNEMYMSGRSLFPLTIEMCHRISRQFKGKMRISFAGGAEYFNCDKLFAAGIWPITVATTILKPAYEPSLFFPFAAPPVHGTLADSGDLFESQARLMLWGVERAIAGFSHIGADTNVQHKLHVVLPGSPNRGVFGGDGAYGEVKSAFDAIVNRARAEKVWSSRVTFAHPKIGWVRGTGLMVGNDPLVAVVERHGIRTYSTAQIADKLLDLCTAESRAGPQGPARCGPDRWPRLRAHRHQGPACGGHGRRREGSCCGLVSGNGWLRRRTVHWTVRLLAWAANQGAAHTDRHQAGSGRLERLDQRHCQAGRRNRHRFRR